MIPASWGLFGPCPPMPVQSEPMGKRSCPSPSPSDGLSTRKSFRSHFVYYIYRHIYIYMGTEMKSYLFGLVASLRPKKPV